MNAQQITVTPSTGTVPLTVTFNAVPSSTVAFNYWDFGDGQPYSYAAQTTHTYVGAGIYNPVAVFSSSPIHLLLIEAVVTVTPPTLSSIAVSPENPVIAAGAQQQFTAIGTYTDGSTQDLTSTTTWSSSSPSFATINAAGLATAVGAGPTTITATSGAIAGSTTLTVTPAPPNITGLSQPSGAIGDQITISGQNFGSLAGTITFNGSPTTASSWNPTTIVTNVPVGATSGGVQVTTAAGGASNSVSFNVLAPTITGLSSSSGAVGSQLIVNGSGFGSSRSDGFGLVVGGAFASAQTWSDGQITATVPVGATTGNVYVMQGGMQSNSLPFTVLSPHLDTINPISGPIGQQITLAGQYFGTTPGQVFIGSKMATVLSWGDQQILAQVADGTATGVVSVYLNGTFTNAILFSVNTPHLDSLSPDHGSVGTQVTLSGSNFGTASGSVTIGNQPAAIQSWSDTQVVATVASNATRGNAVVTQGTLQSNPIFFHLLAPTTSLSLTPPTTAMLVGDIKSLKLQDQNGEPLTGATWTVDNTNILTLSTDDPPVLTAQAPGTATVTAAIGALTSQAAINVYLSGSGGGFSPGTVLWSVPVAQASTILQAVPTGNNTPDLFGIGAMITALTADGKQLWQVPNTGVVVPDNTGGLISANSVNSGFGINKLDGISGLSTWSYTPASTGQFPADSVNLASVAVRPDNTIFAVEDGYLSAANARLVGFDGASGNVVVQQQIPPGTISNSGSCGGPGGQSPSVKGPVTIGPDGSVYMEYWNINSVNTFFVTYSEYQRQLFQGCGTFTAWNEALHLLRIDPNRGVSTQTLYSASGSGSNLAPSYPPQANPREVIPDGQGGVLAAWDFYGNNASTHAHVTHIAASGNSSDYVLPMQGWCGESISFANCDGHAEPDTWPATSLILGDNNTAFATNTDKLVAFDTNTGAPLWTWSAQQGHKVAMVAATAGGGVAAMDKDQNGNQSIARFDASGNPTYDAGLSLTDISYSWYGDWLGSSAAPGAVEMVANPSLDIALSFWAMPGGSASPNSDAVQQEWFPQLQSCLGATIPCAREAIWDALKALRSRLQGPCPACVTNVFDKLGITQQPYYQYLMREPRLYDGTRSNAPMNRVMCPGGFWDRLTCKFGSETVSHFMTTSQSTAISQTPSESSKGMMTFFTEAAICKFFGSTPQGVLNQALLFHESLHGYTGLSDRALVGPSLMGNFGLDQKSATDEVTFYLLDNALGGGAISCAN